MKNQKTVERWLGTWALTGMVAMSLTACADNTKIPNGNSTQQFQLTPAANCDDVEDQVIDALVEDALKQRYSGYGRWFDGPLAGSDNTNANSPEAAPDGSAAPDDFTTTNVQEEGVDEADFMKTDGKFIYTLRNNELIIMKSWPAEDAEIVSRMPLAGSQYPTAMFLKDNRVAIFTQVYEYEQEECDGTGNTPMIPAEEGADVRPGDGPYECYDYKTLFNGLRITVIDVSDRTNPTVLRGLDIEGYYNNARMIGGDVYVVSNSEAMVPDGYWDLIWNDNNNLPATDWESTEEEIETARNAARPIFRQLITNLVQTQGIETLLPQKRIVSAAGTASAASDLYKCTDLYLPQQPTTLGMLNITHLKIDDDTSSMSSTGLLAGGWQVYSSAENLYVAMSSRSWWWGWGDADNSSHIHKFSLDGVNNRARYAASGKVDGWLLNQFSMSEYDNHLRVATTDNEFVWNEATQTGTEAGGNHVIVLKEDNGILVETGSIRNLAPGEQVFSARFMGNKGYVVTFRQTDPLFTFDLTDPTNPLLKGELKINGFSSYIHPMGPNHLLTIGQDATDEGQVQGVHLQIFDVSDLENPTRTYQHLLSTGPWSSWSEAMWDHHAFTYHAGKEILAIPMNSWEDNGSDPFSGLVVLRASNTTGFAELGRVSHGDMVVSDCLDCGWEYHWWVNVRRSIFMDDYLFSISDVGVKVNDLEDPATEHAQIVF